MALSYDDKVAVVRRGFTAWNARDVDQALAGIHPDIEWVTAGMFPDVDPVYHGHDGVRRFWREFVEPWESIEIEDERLVDLPDGLLVLARFRARGREGLELDLRVGQRFTLDEDGEVVAFKAYASHEDALAAIGAAERDT